MYWNVGIDLRGLTCTYLRLWTCSVALKLGGEIKVLRWNLFSLPPAPPTSKVQRKERDMQERLRPWQPQTRSCQVFAALIWSIMLTGFDSDPGRLVRSHSQRETERKGKRERERPGSRRRHLQLSADTLSLGRTWSEFQMFTPVRFFYVLCSRGFICGWWLIKLMDVCVCVWDVNVLMMFSVSRPCWNDE